MEDGGGRRVRVKAHTLGQDSTPNDNRCKTASLMTAGVRQHLPHSLTLTNSLIHTHAHSLTHTLTHLHTHMHTHSHTHTHTHTYAHSLSLSLSHTH